MTAAIRTVALIVLGLCVAAAVAGTQPGSRTYRDRNRCTEQVTSQLFGMEHGDRPRSSCDLDWVEDGTRPAADLGLAFLLVPISLCALAVARWPRRWLAALWSFMTLGITVASIASSFSMTFGSAERTEILWPSQVVGGSILAIYLLLSLQLPAIGISALIRRRARAPAARRTAS